MSQYWIIREMPDGSSKTAFMGWDRPLRYFFIVLYNGDPDETDPVYTNLDDPKNDGSLGYQLKMFKDFLGIEAPDDLIQQLKDDQANNVGNKVVTIKIVDTSLVQLQEVTP